MNRLTKKIRIIPTLLFCGVLGWSTTALADFGILDAGPQSGTVDVTMTVSPLIYIEDPGAIDFGDVNATPTGGKQETKGFCVYSNTSNNEYNVKVYGSQTGSGGAGTFGLLISGGTAGLAGDTIDYTVEWSDSIGPVFTPIVNDSANFNANTMVGGPDITCEDSGGNSAIRLTIAESAFNSANQGNYSDTLTIEVQPSV